MALRAGAGRDQDAVRFGRAGQREPLPALIDRDLAEVQTCTSMQQFTSQSAVDLRREREKGNQTTRCTELLQNTKIIHAYVPVVRMNRAHTKKKGRSGNQDDGGLRRSLLRVVF